MNFPHKRPAHWPHDPALAETRRELRPVTYAELIALSHSAISVAGQSNLGVSAIGQSAAKSHHSSDIEAKASETDDWQWPRRIEMLGKGNVSIAARPDQGMGSFADAVQPLPPGDDIEQSDAARGQSN
ncbi:hypothetical protein [Alterisphingorhabdus coralli]|uniref:Uncharacterized protein n=1 Tax=Alterisphingorhabdus coralli TaxID=3071408 RepID=A0AA97I0E9_9SPHN|nr:hypothetical protein [Parasphingorhabdus sp. SCSIO 66989]WOE74867.1 hypothetical protein RB602_13645 [Parasphingorhabdus sp. SCSIO 66989]